MMIGTEHCNPVEAHHGDGIILSNPGGGGKRVLKGLAPTLKAEVRDGVCVRHQMIDNRIIVLGHLSHINYGQTGNVYSIGGVAPTITENHGKSINILVEASDE